MHQFDQYILGHTDAELSLDSREDNQLASLAMVGQTRRSLDIASRTLDPGVYDNTDFIDALRRMILDNRRCRVRFIVFEAQTIARRGHQLLQLAGDLSSFIEIRQAAGTHDAFNEAILVADGHGYIHRPLGSRYEARINFNDRRASQILLNQFEEIWAQAAPSIHLRRLAI